MKSLRVAESIFELAGTISDGVRAHLVINRLRSAAEFQETAAKTDLPAVAFIPDDETIRRYDADMLTFLDMPNCLATKSLASLISALDL